MILERFGAREGGVPAAVFEALNRKAASGVDHSPFTLSGFQFRNRQQRSGG